MKRLRNITQRNMKKLVEKEEIFVDVYLLGAVSKLLLLNLLMFLDCYYSLKISFLTLGATKILTSTSMWFVSYFISKSSFPEPSKSDFFV